MRAALTDRTPAAPGGPIRGVFFPDAARSAKPGGPMLPKLLAILAAVFLVRALVAGRHDQAPGEPVAGGRRSRRREALARLHRELHATEDGAQAEKEVTA